MTKVRLTGVALPLTWALVAAGLAWASTLGLLAAGAGLAVALLLLLLVSSHDLRSAGMVLLGLTYFLAALNRSEALALVGQSLFITDLVFALALLLLLPSLASSGLPRLALVPVAGLALMFPTFLISTALSAPTYSAAASLQAVAAFAISAIVMPATLIALRPTVRQVQRFAWCFVAGHLVDIVYSVVTNPTTNVRHTGITLHPNGFAQSGLLTFALLLYLLHTTRRRWVVYAAMAASLASIYFSGSRGGIVALAAVILAVPLIERTPLASSALIVLAGIGLIAAKDLVTASGPDSAVGRLAGGGTAVGSDLQREQGLAEGFARFAEHRVIGSGLSDLFYQHSNPLEIAIGGGIIALTGYLLVITSLLLPILSTSPERRLCYAAVAYSAFAVTYPVLGDRTAWLVLSLAIAVFHGFRDPQRPEDESSASGHPEAMTQRPAAATSSSSNRSEIGPRPNSSSASARDRAPI